LLEIGTLFQIRIRGFALMQRRPGAPSAALRRPGWYARLMRIIASFKSATQPNLCDLAAKKG
jgi:hypothetical protein